MLALRRSGRRARLVAAWVLAWFVAMQATALLRPVPAVLPGAAAVHAAQSADTGASAEDCEEHGAQSHGSVPGEHSGADHLVQCPGCLFSTAPPPPAFAPPAAPAVATAAAPRAVAQAPRPSSFPQPPARGPPRFS
jgi:hypothetical protein